MSKRALSLIVAVALMGSAGLTQISSTPSSSTASVAQTQTCQKPSNIQKIYFSSEKYPNIKKHWEDAVAGRGETHKKWPKVLTINRDRASERREELLNHQPEQPIGDGFDQDEYPPAMSRDDWSADVVLVPEHENRSQGSSMGAKLRKFCNGVKWRAIFN
jgi:hypothetical protein